MGNIHSSPRRGWGSAVRGARNAWAAALAHQMPAYSDLTIVCSTQRSRVAACDAHRVRALLGEARVIDDEGFTTRWRAVDDPRALHVHDAHAVQPDLTPRHFCCRCQRSLHACLCAHVPTVENRTSVYILQHPRERFHPFGSVPIARLGLRRVAVDIFGEAFAHRRTWSLAMPKDAVLLYPSPGSIDLAEYAPPAKPQSLVVIDGTWSHAKSIFKQTPALATLPQVRVQPQRPGLYRIRREPALHCMSTIEAIVEALRILEPQTEGLDALLAAFNGMIDRHLELRAQRPTTPYRHVR